MKLKNTFLFIFVSFFCSTQAQDFFPGGVDGAEAWYIVDHDDLTAGVYPNHAVEYIKLDNCGDFGAKSYFNFNPSATTDKLCILYSAVLENTPSRNVFFVGEVKEDTNPYSHLATGWNTVLESFPQVETPIRNRFDLSTGASYVGAKTLSYTDVGEANVNFYHWNQYQVDKKLKSYGLNGETNFYIGKAFSNNDIDTGFFNGNFPEFISFPFELTANEKNRVESYLALKYGITLLSGSYKNAKNTVFWNKVNNNIFKRRIFGIGRDDISGLNQLQSESVHNKDYLIASVGELKSTNKKKQEDTSIENNHFIVFGDNNESDDLVNDANDLGIKTIKRKWLSQNTGEESTDISIYFKVKLMGDIPGLLSENSELKFWMLHDKYVNNLETSDFNGQYVEYYDPYQMDDYAYFKDIHFDPDENIYDQYTFGVGPEMIVQLRFDPNCEIEDISSYVVISGGQYPYEVQINRYGEYYTNFTTYDRTTPFDIPTSGTYTVYVVDSLGLESEVTVDITAYPMEVNLGDEIVLNAGQQETLLDASQGVTDPEAIYKWYRDGVLLEHYDSTLLVTEPGEYMVEITGSNRICIVSDTVMVLYKFNGGVEPAIQCGDETATARVEVNGGVPPFTTIFSGLSLTMSQVHNTEIFYFTDLDFGDYDVTVIDSEGNIFESYISLPDPMSGVDLDLLSQVIPYSSIQMDLSYPTPYYQLSPSELQLDASALVTSTNVTYSWHINGDPINVYTPTVLLIRDSNNPLFTNDPPVYGPVNEIGVTITDIEHGCEITETIAIGRNILIDLENGPVQLLTNIGAEEEVRGNTNTDPVASGISAKVYPNPSERGANFNYEVTSSEVFEGTIEIFTQNGSLLQQISVSGQSSYSHTFSLNTSGTYYITTRTGETLLTNKIIIK